MGSARPHILDAEVGGPSAHSGGAGPQAGLLGWLGSLALNQEPGDSHIGTSRRSSLAEVPLQNRLSHPLVGRGWPPWSLPGSLASTEKAATLEAICSVPALHTCSFQGVTWGGPDSVNHKETKRNTKGRKDQRWPRAVKEALVPGVMGGVVEPGLASEGPELWLRPAVSSGEGGGYGKSVPEPLVSHL